jgi:exosortase
MPNDSTTTNTITQATVAPDRGLSVASRDNSVVVRGIQVGIVIALLVLAFWPILRGICESWFDENAYMEHGILVVPAASYIAWTKRDKLLQVRCEPSVWGLAFVLGGAAVAIVGVLGQWVWASRMSFLLSLAGCIAVFYGFRMVKALAYPIGTLVLMIAPPSFVYDRLTLSLQLLASRIGEAALDSIGYSVMREGNVLELVGIKLSVEQACSGLRSLLSLLFMCVLYNYFFVREKYMRLLILALAVPIAILGNAGRIVATGIASQYSPALVRGASHEGFGYISIVVAAIGCIAVHVGTTYIHNIWRARDV